MQDAELARDLPPIPYSKKDKYGAPYFRAWAPGDYAGEDRMVALVENYHYSDYHKEAPHPMEFMHFKDLNKHILLKDHKMKEVPTALKYGAHLMFKEDPKYRANRIEMEAKLKAEADAEAAANPEKKKTKAVKPLPRKGGFITIWRRTYADTEGYDRFMAELGANLMKRQWADW